MKVFLSWSGSRSHKVAIVFRDWLPSVIQELVPYVSSEDIDKGARWSTDIAKELEDSTFGILCVTHDNINAPWLTFEAGALSKTMDKTLVCPFLFDIKRSEVDGPILQFQSTIFEKEDLKKLVRALNKACEKSGLSADRLEKAFEVWYPTLETELNKLHEKSTDRHDELVVGEVQSPKAQEILEEILELSRINQKLIRNPDGSLGDNLQQINGQLRELIDRTERSDDIILSRRVRKFNPIMLDELFHMTIDSESDGYVGVQIALSLVKNQFPWLYDAGSEVISILRSRRNVEEKQTAIKRFSRILEFTIEHPIMRELYSNNKEMHFFYRRLPDFLMQALNRNLH